MAKQSGEIQSLAEAFRTLADSTRLRILVVLQDREMNVTQLCKRLRMPQPNVSRHLGILRNAGMVSNRREGKEVFYSVAQDDQARTAKSVDMLMKKAPAVRLGPLVMGLAKKR